MILEELSQRLPSLPWAEQFQTTNQETASIRVALEKAHQETAAIRALLEQEIRKREQKRAGRRNGKRFLLRWPSILWAPFRPGWLFLPLGLALLLAVLLCWLRVWSSWSALLP